MTIGRRATTLDRGPPDEGRMVIHTVEQLGPNMSKLPNGSLLCANVPIARVGWMMYGPGETPITPGHMGVAYVERTADTLFDPTCIGSFMGAAVVDEHPPIDVTPDNWKMLSHGFSTTNVRRGTGDDADVLLADLIITDKALIEQVLAGKREVSCGYDADYTQTAEGLGIQTNIIGNHIALVEKGRCGPRCAIGDREFQPPPKKEQPMATKRVKINSGPVRRALVLDGLRKRVQDAEEELAKVVAGGDPTEDWGDDAGTGAAGLPDDDAGGEGGTHIHIHTGAAPEATPAAPAAPVTDEVPDGGLPAPADADPMEARISAIEATLAQIMELLSGGGDEAQEEPAPEDGPPVDPEAGPPAAEEKKTEDEFPEDLEDAAPAKTTDSAALAAGFTTLMAQAEVLVPGFRMPTFDAKAKRKVTIDSMCQTRRKVMDAFMATAAGHEMVVTLTGKKAPTLDGMGCVDVANLFRSAAGAKAIVNNAAATKDSAALPVAETTPVRTIASINAANKAFWEGQQTKK